jgi:hypothetical protein
MKKLILALPVAMALAFSSAAYAQQQQGLVTVNVSDNEILNDLNLQPNVPITVQVPIGIAANVCGIDANVIAEQRRGNENWQCEAETTTQAFANLVSRQHN